MNKYTLGLDLGSNSIGWGLVDEETKNLIDAGVRIFQMAVEPKSKTPKNHKRREKRGQRKNISRKKMRQEFLRKILIENSLMPKSHEEQKLFFAKNPYELRSRSLKSKLELYDLGRIFYHLCQRRGFQSNRKSDAKSDDTKGMKLDISKLSEEIHEKNCKTLGEYFYKFGNEKIRGKHTSRQMYKDEFEIIWKKQQSFFAKNLTEEFKKQICRAIFWQRDLKIQKFLVGNCTFFLNRKRAQKSSLIAQEFRIWQDLSNLCFQRGWKKEEIPIKYKEKILQELQKSKTMNFNKIRKIISKELTENDKFNLEVGKRDKILGNQTYYDFHKVLGEIWEKFSREKQEELIRDFQTINSEESLERRLLEDWYFDKEKTEKLMKINLVSGYMNLSEKAMIKFIVKFQEGLTYSEIKKELELEELKNYKNDEIPNLRNPIVVKALYELKKVLKAVENKYGPPSKVRIEMARDMKNSKKQKEEISGKQKIIEKSNENAKKYLEEKGIMSPSRDDIVKYKLWEECNKRCPYTGKSINFTDLFGSLPVFEIEHIIPFSRCLDDSYKNKTLCERTFNNKIKSNKTPFEVMENDKKLCEEIEQNIKCLPFYKQRKFTTPTEELDLDKFISRQLNDTRYICREVKSWLEVKLGNKNIEVGKGGFTSILRHFWGWNHLLSKEDENKKNREDHRHHCVDAIITAFISRGMLKKASDLSKLERLDKENNVWKKFTPSPAFTLKFREKLDNMIISHAPVRKLIGALHEETGLGKTNEEGVYTKRVKLEYLNAKRIKTIRDKEVQKILIRHLAEFEEDFKKAFAQTVFHKDNKTPINSVVILENKSPTSVYNYRGEGKVFYEYANNHHIEILEHKIDKDKDGNLKRQGIVITTMEATQRVRPSKKSGREKIPIVNKTGNWFNSKGEELKSDKWNFKMSLCINDLVKICGTNEVYRVQKMRASGKEITLRQHLESTLENKDRELNIATGNFYKLEKIQIDPLGNIYPAND